MYYLSTSYRRADDIETVLREIGEDSPIRTVELSGGTTYSSNILPTLKELKREYGFTYLLHNYFPPSENSFVLNIADPSEEKRKRSIEFAKKSIRWSAELDTSHYTIHPGYPESLTLTKDRAHFRSDDPDRPPEKADRVNERFRASLRELLDFSNRNGIKFGVENLFPTGRLNTEPLLCEPDDIISILREFGSNSNFGFLLDIGHLNVTAEAHGFDPESAMQMIIEGYSDQILEIHISHNSGQSDDHNLVPANSWMQQWLRDSSVKSVPITYEPRGYSLNDVLKNMRQHKMIT